MTAIWQNDGSGWHLIGPSGFPDEAALHRLVEEAPHILPLAGLPRLVVVGREVQVGNGYADLIAVDPAGQLAIIEIKLARNAEARRAVVAQVLAYAAYLKGLSLASLEQDILATHLHKRGYNGLADAISANDQAGSFDPASFTEQLAEVLTQGLFRLVFVLDDAPQDLVRLVGYLESITNGLIIDLITVSSYEMNGAQFLVPQRVEDERQPRMDPANAARPVAPKGQLVRGGDDFHTAIASAPSASRANLQRLYDWASALERHGLARLFTYHGKTGLTLLPRLLGDEAGLVSLYNYKGGSLQFWLSVFQRRAPQSLPRIERIIAPMTVGQGTSTTTFSDGLLDALTDAYREASAGRVQVQD